MIEATLIGHRILVEGGRGGVAEITVDVTQALNEVTPWALAEAIEGDALKGGAGTDTIARATAGYNEEAEAFFSMLRGANEIGIDLGGYSLVVEDKEKFINWVAANRPEVLEDIPEEFYKQHSAAA